MMLGWLSDAAVRASRLNRSAMPSPLSRAGAITLMATRRSRAMSWARYTVAMPPRPDPDAHLGGRRPRAAVQTAPQRVGVGLRERLDAAHAAGHERGGVTRPDPPQRAETRGPTRGQRLVRGDARAVGDLRGRSARQPEHVGPSRVS